TRYDTAQQAQVFRDQFRAVIRKAEIPGSWTPRELRHSFVSLMSDSGASEELIADLVGHANTTTTRTVYRHQLRPVITKGAEILDGTFGKGFLDDERPRQMARKLARSGPRRSFRRGPKSSPEDTKKALLPGPLFCARGGT
ncbi:MAG TPA: tyrosine-type recombinase/integrase, partial [Glycomyces sp.]|nr:tyrosine-type recombinase/integrase [Glycomyces sp.]